ncbi:MAG TPA: ATP-binding protein [Verrucomicrobiae bacterium]|nr:ATP-binding protein [Verrucomicrobiae bacterium]
MPVLIRLCNLGVSAVAVLFTTAASAPLMAAPVAEEIAAISDVHALANSQVKELVPIHLTATVLGVDAVHGALAVQDSSGCLWIEAPMLPPHIETGSLVSLRGKAVVGDGRVILGSSQLIDQPHNTRGGLDRCRVFLDTGKHPFTLLYRQLDGPMNLSVKVQLPGQELTNIPSAFLKRRDETTGTWKSGFQYAAFANVTNGWELTSPSSAGITSEFDVNVASAASNFVLRFSGFLDVVDPGEYVFEMRADDSLRFELEQPSETKIEVLGGGALAGPTRIVPGQLWNNRPESVWAEIEGFVRHAGAFEGRLHLEVTAETGRIQVIIANAAADAASALLNRRVRITGLCRAVSSPSGGRMAGWMLAPGMSHVAVRQDAQPEPLQRGALPTLTTIEQIRRLKPEEVTQSYPLKFQGVVTFVFPGGLRAHVQGDAEGIYVSCVNNKPQPLRVGDLCDFEGYSSRGAFSPVVTYRQRTVLGPGQMPEPLRPDWSRLMNGSLDSQWIELQGVVLRVNGPELILGVRGGEVTARVFDAAGGDLTQLLDSVIRVRGTVRAFSGSQRQLQRVLLQVTSPAQITVEDSAPADPFTTPGRSIADLFLFDPNAASLYRVRTHGQVVHVRDGMGYIMDGTNGMRFVARAGQEFSVGDLVEVVGFPETEGFAPVMRQSLVKAAGRCPLPEFQDLAGDDLLNRAHDSTLVAVQATLLNIRTNQSDYLLELQADSHTFTARLNNQSGFLPLVPMGSQVRISGLYSLLAGHANHSNSPQPFELFLNSPSDLVVLSRPAWWTLQHTLLAMGAMTLFLVLSSVWITALRRRVDLRTRELRDEIETRKRTEEDLQRSTGELQKEIQERIQLHAELGEQKNRLEIEIEERKRMEVEVEAIHRQLMVASRQAGQAEVASSVLHNVGNVLNSVNVSSGLLISRLQGWQINNVNKAAELLTRRTANLGVELAADDPLRRVPDYLEKLATHLDHQRQELLTEVKDLGENVEHIKEIVAMQQTYARVSGVLEKVDPRELVESAIKMHAGAFARHQVHLVREFQSAPLVLADRHKVLQILVNLLHNAKYACDEGPAEHKQVTVKIQPNGKSAVVIEVADNGVGISPESMKRLFSHGFTTRKNGHGFGLHSAAIAAKELGGRLSAASEGQGRGATFTLEIPVEQTSEQESARPRAQRP